MRLFGFGSRQIAEKPLAADPAIWQGDAPFRVIGGRRRKAGIPYMVPWDIEEHNRLDFQHFMLRYALRGNYAAPLRNPSSILDVGSGTGRWAIEMANTFPGANVMGLDVNPPPVDSQAEEGIDLRPANYAFVPGNLLEGLPFADRTFDFTHMRALVTAIPHERWPFVIGELMRVTRPRGWVESLEVTFLQGGGPAINQLMAWLDATLATRGVVFMNGGRVGDVMRAVGLGHVTVRALAMPCGEHGGRVGRMLALDWITVLRGLSGMTIAQGITSEADFDQTLEAARLELESPSLRCIMPLYIAFGQRTR
ncbi:MAG TPA: class I SAM-dependent methyltransferase [Ktedonobacterales bacterium]